MTQEHCWVSCAPPQYKGEPSTQILSLRYLSTFKYLQSCQKSENLGLGLISGLLLKMAKMFPIGLHFLQELTTCMAQFFFFCLLLNYQRTVIESGILRSNNEYIPTKDICWLGDCEIYVLIVWIYFFVLVLELWNSIVDDILKGEDKTNTGQVEYIGLVDTGNTTSACTSCVSSVY